MTCTARNALTRLMVEKWQSHSAQRSKGVAFLARLVTESWACRHCWNASCSSALDFMLECSWSVAVCFSSSRAVNASRMRSMAESRPLTKSYQGNMFFKFFQLYLTLVNFFTNFQSPWKVTFNQLLEDQERFLELPEVTFRVPEK